MMMVTLLILLVTSISIVGATDSDDNDSVITSHMSLLEACRKVGFDPWQLACETCDLLPPSKTNNKITCQDCCQSYKTSDRMTKPYESAVLVHLPKGSHPRGDTEMDQFLDEDLATLVKQKGSKRIITLEHTDESSRSQSLFYMMRPRQSQQILWFDTIVSNGQSLKAYKNQAKEIIPLDGYKRDDIKDMITTLLP